MTTALLRYIGVQCENSIKIYVALSHEQNIVTEFHNRNIKVFEIIYCNVVILQIKFYMAWLL